MRLPMGHLLASSAVAGLLFLLPVGDANAQDNRNTQDWGAAGGVVLSFIAGGASLLVLQRGFKGKRDDGKMDTIFARFDQLDSGVSAVDTNLEGCINNGVNKLIGTLENKTGNFNDRFDQLDSGAKALDEKLTKLETNSEEGIQDLSRTLESKMNLGSFMNTVSDSLETIEQRTIKIEEMTERAIGKKEDNQTVDPCISNFDQAIEIYNNQPRSIIIDTNAIIDGRIIKMLESGV